MSTIGKFILVPWKVSFVGRYVMYVMSFGVSLNGGSTYITLLQ